jgi:hypothetical protein
MTSRPSLVRSIPFWILLAGSLALTAIGAWLVIDRLARIESAIVSQSAEAGIEVYVGQPAVLAGGVLLGAGLVGLLLSLTVAALSTLRPVPAAEEIETIDWTEDEDAAPVPQYSASAAATSPAASAAPVAAPAPAGHADPVIGGHADPVITEDPDVETPSTATPPANARD